MKNFIFTFLFFAVGQVRAQTLSMTDETTDISFVTTHLAGQLEGKFKRVEGTCEFDTMHLSSAFLKLSFATSTITINDNLAGPNLIKGECFDSKNYPKIELSSSSIVKLPAVNQYQFKGTLTVRGVTKPLVFPFTAKANAGGYDFNFAFSFVKKNFGLHCGATGKTFKIIVRAYAKKKLAV